MEENNRMGHKTMRVLKRDGAQEEVSFDKVLRRIRVLSEDLSGVDAFSITQKVCARIYDGVRTSELDELAAQMCASLVTEHPDYGTLASRIIVSNHQKNTSPSFSEVVGVLYHATDVHGRHNPLVSKELYEVVQLHKEKINSVINYERDFLIDYFGFKTLERSYLLRVGNRSVERPQHLWMRVALGIHGHDIKDAMETYEMMSTKLFTHATPTLFNAGTPSAQMSSCFAANTKVFTLNRGVVHICDVQIGDQVVTHAGKVQTVTQLHKNPLGDRSLLRLRAHMTPDVIVTGNHRFWTVTHDDLEPKWRAAEELLPGHSIVLPWREGVTPVPGPLDPPNPEIEKARALGGRFGIGMKGILTPTVFAWDQTLVFAFLEGMTDARRKRSSAPKPSGDDLRTLYHLCRSVGIPAGISEDGQLVLHEHHSRPNPAAHVAAIILGVEEVSEEERAVNEYVYTLGVEGDHSYSVEGLLCENCYLLGLEDSVAGMYKNLADCAQISKYAGGIGIHMHNIRAKGSHIRGTNGTSSGIIPLLRVYNATARHINQAGKRLGSIAIYMEPWHADIEAFLEIRKNHGNEDERCRDLFTAMWIPDLFMKRVEADGEWSLMCPDECPGLSDVYGDEFEALYTRYEAEGRQRKRVKAQSIWMAILKSQIETGTPYLCYKDSVNKKSNQKNIGIIKSSNLCSEIMEVSHQNEAAVCNLASIALGSFVIPATPGMNEKPRYDFEKLHKIAGVITKNINKVIDKEYYPTPETELSNRRHRPIGIGVQGLADAFALMRFPYDSPEAAKLNREIFETIYHGALTASMRIAKKRNELIAELEGLRAIAAPSAEQAARAAEIEAHLGRTPEEASLTAYKGSYATFAGSPASQGQLQFDLWGVVLSSGLWDWDTLKKEIVEHGLRNSLLLAPMPTASTSQILSSNECFEAFTSNIYQRRTLSGEFTIVNRYLLRDLLELGLWNVELKDRILAGNGSVQHIEEIPAEIRALYKTVWEIKQKVLIDLAADRGAYVCQSQSLNLFVEDPDFKKLTNMHFYSWRKGLKTGIYYLRTRPKARTMAFTLDPALVASGGRKPGAAAASPQKEAGAEGAKKDEGEVVLACSRDNPDCLMCSG